MARVGLLQNFDKQLSEQFSVTLDWTFLSIETVHCHKHSNIFGTAYLIFSNKCRFVFNFKILNTRNDFSFIYL
jgi:hypothetical protein